MRPPPRLRSGTLPAARVRLADLAKMTDEDRDAALGELVRAAKGPPCEGFAELEARIAALRRYVSSARVPCTYALLERRLRHDAEAEHDEQQRPVE